MFCNLVANAKKEVQDELELLRHRFGGWKSRQQPTLFSYACKKWKKKGFSKTSEPMMAPALVHFKDSDKEMENGTPKCWRGSSFLKIAVVTSRSYILLQSINKLKQGRLLTANLLLKNVSTCLIFKTS